MLVIECNIYYTRGYPPCWGEYTVHMLCLLSPDVIFLPSCGRIQGYGPEGRYGPGDKSPDLIW